MADTMDISAVWMPEVSARRMAATRLDGMNLAKMLDIQGDGFIHQVVLARTLHIFDQEVFTQPAVQEIMESLVSLNPDRTDGRVPLRALIDHLSAPTSARSIPSIHSLPRSARSNRSARSGSRSGSKTPTKVEVFSDSVDAYTDSLVCDIRGFNEVVKPEALANATGTSPEEIEALRAQLKAHARQYVIEAQKRNICPIWDEFDKNGDGVLAPDECTALVAAYLHTMARKASEVIRGSIELGIELSLIISEKTVKDEAVRQQMRTHARLQVEAIHANVAPLVQQMLDRMADEDPHTIAGELLESLDFDQNGKVTRNEFEQRFVESMQYVLGPEGLMDKLQQKNSLQ